MGPTDAEMSSDILEIRLFWPETGIQVPQTGWTAARCTAPVPGASVTEKEIHIHQTEDRMNRAGRSIFASFQRVQEFLAQHPLSEVPASLGAQATELGEVVARLTSGSVNQANLRSCAGYARASI